MYTAGNIVKWDQSITNFSLFIKLLLHKFKHSYFIDYISIFFQLSERLKMWAAVRQWQDRFQSVEGGPRQSTWVGQSDTVFGGSWQEKGLLDFQLTIKNIKINFEWADGSGGATSGSLNPPPPAHAHTHTHTHTLNSAANDYRGSLSSYIKLCHRFHDIIRTYIIIIITTSSSSSTTTTTTLAVCFSFGSFTLSVKYNLVILLY